MVVSFIQMFMSMFWRKSYPAGAVGLSFIYSRSDSWHTILNTTTILLTVGKSWEHHENES